MGWELVAVAFAAGSINQSRQANKAQKRAAAEQQAGNSAEAARERRMQLREERIRRGTIISQASATGTEGSSGEVGSLGSLSTNLSSNIGTNLGRLQVSQNISIFQQQAADYLNRSQTYSSLSNLAGNMSKK